MTGSNVRHSDATSGANVATPHAPRQRQGRAREAVRLATTRIPPAASTPTPRTWRNGCRCCSRAVSSPTARACSPTQTYAPADDDRHTDAVPQMPPELAALQRELPRLRARPERGRLPRPKVLMHTGGLPGYVSKVFWIPDAAAWSLRADEPGIVRGLRLDRLPRCGPLPRRAGVRLDRGVSQGRGAAAAAIADAGAEVSGTRATHRRARRSRWPATPAPTPTPGTATSPSRRRTASS